VSIVLDGFGSSLPSQLLAEWHPILNLLVAVVTLAGVVAGMGPSSRRADEEAASISRGKIPPGYRDWRLISVAHEEGDLNDIRAVLGNNVAIKAYREGKPPFPDGTIIARLAWKYVPSEENNKTFGRAQSFVAGPPVNGVQFMVKDSKNTPRPAAGGSLNLTTANPPARRCSRAAFPATRSSKIAILSSRATRLNTENHNLACIRYSSVRSRLTVVVL